MATIQLHPDVENYVHYLTLDEIAARPSGVMDLFEDGRLIIVKDYRLAFDHDVMTKLNGDISKVENEGIRRKLKKLSSTSFFEGEAPKSTEKADGTPSLQFNNPLQQAIFDTICRGDVSLFERARDALQGAHEEISRIFALAFPTYKPFRLIPSIRITETLFENLHWDNHSIEDDFQQARVFCNLDTHKRVWSISHNFLTYLEKIYDEHNLSRFAGQDPNTMISYVTGKIMGGTHEMWKDTLPRHRVAFDPGEVWIGESRLISHQIYYGEAAMVYMWFVELQSMNNQEKRFNARIEKLHRDMADRPKLGVHAA